MQSSSRDIAIKPLRTRIVRGIRIASVLLLTPALSGCILGSERPELNLEVPASYREAPRAAPDAAVPAVDWWRGFRSSELTTLMEAAQTYNLDIAVAIAQIVQADAQVGISGSPLLPSVSGTGSTMRPLMSRASAVGSAAASESRAARPCHSSATMK